MKVCRVCKIEKALTEFYAQKKNKDNLKTECKTCHYEAHKIYRANGGQEKEKENRRLRKLADPNYSKNSSYKTRYGITADDYDRMLKEQDGKCKLCNKEEHVRGTTPDKKPKRLAVDHCHKTGKVRGLLCHNCNVMLGQYEKWKDKFPLFEEYIKGRGFYSNEK